MIGERVGLGSNTDVDTLRFVLSGTIEVIFNGLNMQKPPKLADWLVNVDTIYRQYVDTLP